MVSAKLRKIHREKLKLRSWDRRCGVWLCRLNGVVVGKDTVCLSDSGWELISVLHIEIHAHLNFAGITLGKVGCF